jgi:D-beta-D-heptose 7-phosphate kinase / D-beta-D-heptose 1-phosphate adenosyltransferase
MSHEANMSALLALPDRFAELNIWVIGDLMIDEYVTGTVERISPEAPVPVVRAQGSERRLGGAANVARQIAILGAHVSVAGVCGEDAAGQQLRELCTSAGIDTRAVLELPGRNTTRKLRVVSHSQQLLRLDWEDISPCAAQVGSRLLARLRAGAPPDAIVLSDYAKGVLTPETMAAVLRERGSIPLVVDPKHRDFARYRGATTVTPNLHELEAAAGRSLDVEDSAGIAAAARALIASAGLESMVVTLGSRGMLVVPADGVEVVVPAHRHEVYDVTGAGDTAIAVLALALAAHAPLVQAAQLANAAAGVSVCQVGAVAVSAASIRDALAARPDGKLLSRHELAARAATWRTDGKRIVFSNGCFDLLHAGHLALLSHAAQLGDVLVLAINSDASVRRLKGENRPVQNEGARAEVLAALEAVDLVALFEEDTPINLITQIKPSVLVKGADYTLEQVVGREIVEAHGGEVRLVDILPGFSTTSLVDRARGGRA